MAARFGATALAAFVAGAGLAAVVAYLAVADQRIRDVSRRTPWRDDGDGSGLFVTSSR